MTLFVSLGDAIAIFALAFCAAGAGILWLAVLADHYARKLIRWFKRGDK